MSSLKFEWDDNKNALNQKKHGVSFEEAKTVFADERGRLIPDPDHSASEERFILLGVSANLRLLVVCHCERDADTIRIISARKAAPVERRQYEGGRHA
ncbi:MAG: BrnT family toxin [Pseudomonadota bacterium]